MEFVDRLPAAKVPGVGPNTLEKLTEMGVRFLGDIRRFPAPMFARSFGSYGARLLELSQGIDPTPVSPDTPAKSISSEGTLERIQRRFGKAAIGRAALSDDPNGSTPQ